ncbi:MAG: NADH-quinone oxidoreductase subunit I [Myxococcaceae bacterium]|nr:NADH-quinone oxidoreductase subunit I [Myxococcaceae bacterium]
MRHFLDALKNVGTIAKSFVRPRVTVEFPKQLRPRAERYRASFALLHEADGDEACIGCLQCERICPSKVIAIKGPVKRDSPITGKKRSYADDFTLDLSACIFCELCVQVCPTDAIVMTREQEEPAYGRETLVLTMAKLYENEKSKTRAWGDGTKLMGMQVPPKPPAEAKPADAPKPVEAKPAEATKPVEAKTAATPPPEAPKPVEAMAAATPPPDAPKPVGAEPAGTANAPKPEVKADGPAGPNGGTS